MLPLSVSALDLQAFSYGFLFFILTIAAFFLFATSWSDKLARRFAITALFGALINIFAFLYHITPDIDLARTYRVISQGFNIPFIWTLLALSLAVYERYRPVLSWMRTGSYVIGGLAVAFILPFTLDLMGGTYVIGALPTIDPLPLTPAAGPYLVWYIFLFLAANIFSAVILAHLWRNAETHEGRVMGMLMFLCIEIPILTRWAGYGPWYGIGSSEYLSLIVTVLSGPIFAFGVTYAIIRHRVFPTRLIAAELFIFALWIFVFFRALLAPSVIAAIPDIFLLIATIVLGVFLIRAVLREVEQKEALEKVSAELRTLNSTLEEKVAERTEALSRASTHLEAILENLPSGIIEAKQDGTVTRINRAAEKLLGLERRSVIGKKAAAGSPTGLVLRAAPTPPRSGEERRSEDEAEVSILEPKRRELLVATIPIALDQGEKGYIKLMRDVTREKLIDQAKSEFISIAAHQLRTPIAALRWSLNLILGGQAGRVSKVQKEILEQGNRGVENMVRLINDLLNAARIADGKFKFVFESGDITAAIKNVMGLFDSKIAEKGLTLMLRPGKKVGAFPFDQSKMTIVLQNLIDNAIKYTPQGGSVSVEVTGKGEQVFVAVSDTGIGIPKEEQSRLFEKFFRSKRATQMFTDGSGLGLFIVKTIVEGHGGTITIDSKEGQGTRVIVALPRNPHSTDAGA